MKRTGILLLLAMTLGLPACGFDLDLDLTGADWNSIQFPCTPPGSWEIRGFEHQHFSSPSDALLTATIHRRETVRLTLSTRPSSSCDGTVASVQWVSTAPSVASVTANDATTAELRGVAVGETEVSAEVTFADGSQRTAQIYAVPSAGSPPLRVYAVRVVR